MKNEKPSYTREFLKGSAWLIWNLLEVAFLVALFYALGWLIFSFSGASNAQNIPSFVAEFEKFIIGVLIFAVSFISLLFIAVMFIKTAETGGYKTDKLQKMLHRLINKGN